MLLNKVQWCSESSQYKNFLSVEWLESLILNSRLRSSALAAAVVVIVLIVVYRSSPSQSTDFFPPHCFKLSPHTHGSQYAKISCKKKGSNVQDSRLKLLSKFQVVSRVRSSDRVPKKDVFWSFLGSHPKGKTRGSAAKSASHWFSYLTAGPDGWKDQNHDIWYSRVGSRW